MRATLKHSFSFYLRQITIFHCFCISTCSVVEAPSWGGVFSTDKYSSLMTSSLAHVIFRLMRRIVSAGNVLLGGRKL